MCVKNHMDGVIMKTTYSENDLRMSVQLYTSESSHYEHIDSTGWLQYMRYWFANMLKVGCFYRNLIILKRKIIMNNSRR